MYPSIVIILPLRERRSQAAKMIEWARFSPSQSKLAHVLTDAGRPLCRYGVEGAPLVELHEAERRCKPCEEEALRAYGEVVATESTMQPTMGLPLANDPRRIVGVTYRNVGQLHPTVPRDPFEVDPNKVDRGLQGHATTQDKLAAFLRGHGFGPLSPHSDDPDFDIAWQHDRILHVAEIKSTTPENEEKQLRLGLGQVLRYRHVLMTEGRRVVAVLVPERKPTDEGWVTLCLDLGVRLVWPETFEKLLAANALKVNLPRSSDG